jgi:soluble lytic murein transglycosylase-like protein
MRSRPHAQARAQNSGNILLVLFLGAILAATMWVMRNGVARDPYVYQAKFASFTHLLTAAPPETVEVTPSVFDQEAAMTPRELMTRWDPLVIEASRRFHVPANWIRAVMRMESGGRTVEAGDMPITSDAGAVGIMQVMPGTYDEMREQYNLGADPYDPHDNVIAGAAYLRWLHGKYGYPAMFAAYNDGPGNLEDHLNNGRKLPTETKHYIATISRMLGRTSNTAKFTRPDGSPVLIDSTKVKSLRAAAPGEYGDGVQAVLNIGRKIQAVREDVATVTALLRDHGGNL